MTRGRMTKSECRELRELMAPRFDAIDRRFDAMDQRFDTMDQRLDATDERSDASAGRLRRIEILAEQNGHQIRLLAEAVSGVGEKLEALRSEMSTGFQGLRDLLQTSHRDPDRRVASREDRPKA